MNKVNYQKTFDIKFLGFKIFTINSIYTENSYEDLADDVLYIEEEEKNDK